MTQFNSDGWPVNEDGKKYSYKEIITSGGAIPRPQDVDLTLPYWQYRSELKTTKKTTTRRRRSSGKTRRTFEASSVLSSLEIAAYDRAQAMGELVDRFNKRNKEPIICSSPSGVTLVSREEI